MGKGFTESAGSAIKNKLDYIKFDFGVNSMRIVGEILPRYAYWRKLKEFQIPIECLSFDREKEAFTNIEKDWYKHYFPKFETGFNKGKDVYPTWSYVGRAIDPKDGKLKMVGFKKKLFEQIQTLAKKDGFGSPTDPETGWSVVFEKKSTGPLAVNVEYTLDPLEIHPCPLTDEEKELIKDMPSIESLVPRLSADEQHAFIKTNWLEPEPAQETNVDNAVVDGFDDDIPF